jgi:hypothetical protein
MRRAQETTGHAAQLVRRRPGAHPDRARALSGNIAKGAAERAQALLARLESDLSDGQLGVAEQRHRPLDAPREKVPMRRDAESRFERSREVRLGDAAHPRQAQDGPRLV